MATKAIVNITNAYSDYDGNLIIEYRTTAAGGYLADNQVGPMSPDVPSATINTDIRNAAKQHTIDDWGFTYDTIDTVRLVQIVDSLGV